MISIPRVSIIIVSHNGREHLPACLGSLGELDYPPDLLEIILVDNGSDDGTAEFVRVGYPGVRVIQLGGNLGFAEPNNIAAAEAKGKYLALINNDMKVDRAWLKEMVRAAREGDVACVGGRVLSWDGEEVDFSGGVVNFEGRGFQLGFKVEGAETAANGEEIPFANGGSMLIRKDVFLEAGGFDSDYFAYYEDVDLGWRLWLYGQKVVFARGAITYHRHGATTRKIPEFKKRFLRQRNALFTVLKNYGDGVLFPALSASLLLAVHRALPSVKIHRSEFHLEEEKRGLDFDTGRDLFERSGAAEIVAVQAVARALPRLTQKREEVQGRRKVSDEEVLRKFGDPFRPIQGGEGYSKTHEKLISILGLRRSFKEERKPRILFVTRSIFGERMSGPDVRFLEIARALGEEFRVVITTPYAVEDPPKDVEIVRVEDPAALEAELGGAEVVFTSGFALESYPSLRQGKVPLVIDLYCPFVLENLEFHKRDPGGRSHQRSAHTRDLAVLERQLQEGDYFLCSSDREADFVLGVLLAAGRINPDTYGEDPRLEQLVGVVPFGIPEKPPVRRRRAIRETFRTIRPRDKVLLWGGGIQPWMDPATLIRAMAKVVRKRSDVKLVFLGAKHPSPEVPETGCLDECVQLARELGLYGKTCFFHGWVPYEDRENFLLDADIGVSAHPETLEARFSFRTRYLDYLWASLPILVSGWDPLAEEAEAAEAAVITPPEDPDALSEAILELVGSPKRLRELGKAASRLAVDYPWSEVVAPLAAFCRRSHFARDKGVPDPGPRPLRTAPDGVGDDIRQIIRQKAEERKALKARIGMLERELRLAEPLLDRVMGSFPFRIYNYIVQRKRNGEIPSTIPVKGKRPVRQSFLGEKENLCGVGIRIAGYGRQNTADCTFRLWRGERELAHLVVNASQLPDNQEFLFRFDPIPESRGERFTVSIESPESYLGNFPGCYLRPRRLGGLFGKEELEHRPIYL